MTPRRAKRALLWSAVLGVGGVLVPALLVVILAVTVASPVNAVANWLGGLFGAGNTAMICPATSPASPVALSVAASSRLVVAQQIFAVDLARASRLDVTVISAWLLQEENGSAAAGRAAAHNNDWLNIGYTDTATYGATDSIWRTPASAALASYEWMAGRTVVAGYGAGAPGIQAILLTAGQSPLLQIHAIQVSGWASGGEAELLSIYASLTASSAGNAPTTAQVLGEAPGAQASYAVYERYVTAICDSTDAPTLQLTPGDRATILPNGTAAAPADAPRAVKLAINAANQLISKPYLYGGGHGINLNVIQPAYDCSGSSSYVLYKSGVFPPDEAWVSGQFETWGAGGPGRWISVYANSAHMFLAVAGLVFNTAHYAPTFPAGTGPRWQPASTVAPQFAGDQYGGFVTRHPVGL